MWSVGRIDLELSEKEFWQLNLKKLDALMRRKNKVLKMKKKKADYRAGIIASVIANVNRDPKKKAKAYEPEDFMPVEKRTKKQDWKSQLKIVEMLNAAFNGKDKRGGAD